jgi:predicted molibdopterin-dependent oxidoreductase YjgC
MAITLTINDQRVVASDGATILEAARGAGIRIPTLCHHPDLTHVGACRLCVVTVEKARGLQTACTTPAFEGMVVHTESPEARDTRRFVLEMLLSDHPNECMICEVNGACELQDLVYEYNVAWPEHSGARHHYEINPDPNPFVFIDRNKCILCGRCVRACAEIQNRDVWAFAQRGFKSKLVAGADQNLLDARCESCGQCVAYCPVGALYDKMSVGQGRAGQITKVRTTCSYCGVGCNFDLNVRDDRIVRVTSAPDAPVNGMRLCVKGRYGYDYVHHSDRLTKPLVRAQWLDAAQLEHRLANGEWRIGNARVSESASRVDQPVAGKRSRRLSASARGTEAGHLASFADSKSADSPWIEVDWDTALDVVAGKFAQFKSESGPSALAVLTSAKCTNEENYLVNKLVRQVLGTNSVDHCARL